MVNRYLTLSPENQFRFPCPVFNVEVKFSQCASIRDAVYVGKELPVRKGCQACIRDSKCPAAEVVRKISFQRNTPDDYGSLEPVVGKIRKDILERIAPIMVRSPTMDRYGVPEAERALISSSSERIRKSAGLAPLPSGDYTPRRESAPTKKLAAKKTPPKINAVNQAAATGDLAAAVSS